MFVQIRCVRNEAYKVGSHPSSPAPQLLGMRYYVVNGIELSKVVTLLDASTFCEALRGSMDRQMAWWGRRLISVLWWG